MCIRLSRRALAFRVYAAVAKQTCDASVAQKFGTFTELLADATSLYGEVSHTDVSKDSVLTYAGLAKLAFRAKQFEQVCSLYYARVFALSR